MGDDRAQMLDRIRESIASVGHHVTLVQGGIVPRFAYTIGLSDRGDAPELVLAGTSTLSGAEVKTVLDAVAPRAAAPEGEPIVVEGVGSFALAPADPTWARRLLLGVFDFYGGRDVPVGQVVPLGDLWTVDVPDLSRPFGSEPVWRWLEEPWPYEVPESSVTATNLDALRGHPVTEAARWEDDEWEMFHGSGPDTPEADVRFVPLATLLGFDPTLDAVARLDVGRAIQREAGGEWEAWGE